jgi:hypothetical protein
VVAVDQVIGVLKTFHEFFTDVLTDPNVVDGFVTVSPSQALPELRKVPTEINQSTAKENGTSSQITSAGLARPKLLARYKFGFEIVTSHLMRQTSVPVVTR